MNQVAILQTLKQQDVENYRSFLILVTLDYCTPDAVTDKMVQVHALQTEMPVRNGYGFEDSPYFDFAVTRLAINELETSFLAYGKKGILVANFPSMLQNMSQKRDDRGNLEAAPQDLAIECEMVAADELEDTESLEVLQAEFSVLNTNYLSVLLVDTEKKA